MHAVLFVIVLTLTPSDRGVSASVKVISKPMPSIQMCQAVAEKLPTDTKFKLIPVCVELNSKDGLIV